MYSLIMNWMLALPKQWSTPFACQTHDHSMNAPGVLLLHVLITYTIISRSCLQVASSRNQKVHMYPPIVIVRKKEWGSGYVHWLHNSQQLYCSWPVHYTMHQWSSGLPIRQWVVFCLGFKEWLSNSYERRRQGKNNFHLSSRVLPVREDATGYHRSTCDISVPDGKGSLQYELLQVLVFFVDLIVFGKTLEEHKEQLLKVLDRLCEVGLKISLDKCHFCQTKVKYVGHIVSTEGVAVDPADIEAYQPEDPAIIFRLLWILSQIYHN